MPKIKRQASPSSGTPEKRRLTLRSSEFTQVQGKDKISPMMESSVHNTKIEDQCPKQFQVKICWGKNEYFIEIDMEEPFDVLQAQIFALTQVIPDRQRIIFEGKIIRDSKWPASDLYNGCEIRMIGSNDSVVMPVIVEDDTKTSNLKKRMLVPYGIKNFGNTCFMNSVLQILRTVPELKRQLLSYAPPEIPNAEPNEISTVTSLSKLFIALENRDDGYEKHMLEFISYMEKLYPEYGASLLGRSQQDACEFFFRLLAILQKTLSKAPAETDPDPPISIEQLFGILVQKTYTCLEADGDAQKVINETDLYLNCFISSGTKHMMEGIKAKLFEEVQMSSEALKRDSKFSIKSDISRAPAFICVQFVRFFYKEAEQINAKILKDVKFPLKFDIIDLCSPELKKIMGLMRFKIREFENKISIASSEAKRGLLLKAESGTYNIPEQNLTTYDSGSGLYSLVGVLTHEGRTSNSGHYIGWIKVEEKKWAKIDDNSAHFIDEEEVLKLSGGGEYHCAYLLIYQSFKLPRS